MIEYALLAAFIGVCAVLAWTNIPPKIAAAYGNWDATQQNLGACTPNPGGDRLPNEYLSRHHDRVRTRRSDLGPAHASNS